MSNWHDEYYKKYIAPNITDEKVAKEVEIELELKHKIDQYVHTIAEEIAQVHKRQQEYLTSDKPCESDDSLYKVIDVIKPLLKMLDYEQLNYNEYAALLKSVSAFVTDSKKESLLKKYGEFDSSMMKHEDVLELSAMLNFEKSMNKDREYYSKSLSQVEEKLAVERVNEIIAEAAKEKQEKNRQNKLQIATSD